MKGWRTVIFNGVSGLLSLVAALVADMPVEAQTALYITAVVNAVNVVLRAVTNTSIGESA